MIEHNIFWFHVLFFTGIVFISLAIFFSFKIVYGVEVEDYKDCIEKEIPPPVCEMMYPPMKLKSVNYTMLIPFP